jgi:hypothetical protein
MLSELLSASILLGALIYITQYLQHTWQAPPYLKEDMKSPLSHHVTARHNKKKTSHNGSQASAAEDFYQHNEGLIDTLMNIYDSVEDAVYHDFQQMPYYVNDYYRPDPRAIDV